MEISNHNENRLKIPAKNEKYASDGHFEQKMI